LATFDVNDAFDPSFFDPIQVLRRTVVVDPHGRGQVTETTIATQAVVVPSPPTDLNRLPEMEVQQKTITLYAPFRFQGASVDPFGNEMHPDKILWHGGTFLVRQLDDYTPYGRGFTMAIATSIQAIDLPPAGSA
jgi:hypothetical protein